MAERSFKVGTLVRVKDDALTRGMHAHTNREYVAQHGYLYIVRSMFAESILDELKSVATGEVSSFFIDREIEEAPTDE